MEYVTSRVCYRLRVGKRPAGGGRPAAGAAPAPDAGSRPLGASLGFYATPPAFRRDSTFFLRARELSLNVLMVGLLNARL
jgi:hypothetical protein